MSNEMFASRCFQQRFKIQTLWIQHNYSYVFFIGEINSTQKIQFCVFVTQCAQPFKNRILITFSLLQILFKIGHDVKLIYCKITSRGGCKTNKGATFLLTACRMCTLIPFESCPFIHDIRLHLFWKLNDLAEYYF